jgi:hypothetical protein
MKGEILLEAVGAKGNTVIVMWRLRKREELNVCNGFFMFRNGLLVLLETYARYFLY